MPMPGRHATRLRARYDARACLPAFTTGSSVWQGMAMACCGAATTTDLTGAQRVFGAGLYAGLPWRFCGACWPDLGPWRGFAAGVQCWAGACAGLRCLFSLYGCTVLCGYTVCLAYGIAYGLAYGIEWARPALSLWLRPARACFLSIHRIMKPC